MVVCHVWKQNAGSVRAARAVNSSPQLLFILIKCDGALILCAKMTGDLVLWQKNMERRATKAAMRQSEHSCPSVPLILSRLAAAALYLSRAGRHRVRKLTLAGNACPEHLDEGVQVQEHDEEDQC